MATVITWVLIIILRGGMYSDTPAVTAVDGFATKEACEKAAAQFYGEGKTGPCLEKLSAQ